MTKGLAFQLQVYISVSALADVFAKWNATILTWLRIFRCELKNKHQQWVLVCPNETLKQPCKMDMCVLCVGV